jgi:hypothetical protein
VRTFERLIAFVRPWDAPMLLALARELVDAGVSESVQYITMWKMAYDFLKPQLLSHEELTFLPNHFVKTRVEDARVDELKQLETTLYETTGTPFKMMLAAERFKPEERVAQEAFLWSHVDVLERLIPPGSLLLSQGPDHLCYWLAVDLARGRGGAFMGFTNAGRPSYHTQMHRSASELWAPRMPTDADHEKVAEQREALLSGIKPSYMHRRKSHVTAASSLKYRASLLDEMQVGNYFGRLRDVVAFSGMPDLRSKSRWRTALRKMEPKRLDDLDVPFIYFPLHLEPEAATLVYAPVMNDQAYAIEVLARSLPAGVSLVLKENPKMWGKRPHSFYDRVNQNAGVIWIDPSTSPQELLERCEAVVTLTGTVALEACLLDVPVALFGSPPFASVLTSLPRIASVNGLKDDLLALLNRSLWPAQKQLLDEYAHYVANLVPSPFFGTDVVDDVLMPVVPMSAAYLPLVLDALK